MSARTRYLIAIPIVLIIAAIPLIANTYYTNLMIMIGIYTMITVGLCLLMGFAGQISLGHAAFYGMGAYISGILSATFHVSPWISLVIAAVATGIMAFLIGIPIFRLKGYYLAMVTLGLGMIVNVLMVELSGITGGPSGFSGIPKLTIGSFAFDNDFKFYYLVWAFCLAVLLISDNIVHSRVGRALRSVHSSEAAAASVGVNVSQLKIMVFVLSAVFASLAGSLYAHYIGFISPQPFGFLFSIRLVVMVVIGGLASVWGAIFGAATTTLLGDILQPLGDLDVIAFGLILMIIMIFLPSGLTRGVLDSLQAIRNRGRQKEQSKLAEVEN